MDLGQVAERWGHLLSAEQQDFVQAFVVTRSIGATAEMLDISRSRAKRLLDSPTIQAAIKFAERSLREGVHVTPEEVISDLRLMRDMALGRIPVPETKWVDGVPMTQYVRQYNAGAANKAVENLGRVVGMFTDKKEISMPATDNQLKKRLEDLLGVSLDEAIDGEIVTDESQTAEIPAPPETLSEAFEACRDDELTELLAQACEEKQR